MGIAGSGGNSLFQFLRNHETRFLLVHYRPCKALKLSVIDSIPKASPLTRNKTPNSTCGPRWFQLVLSPCTPCPAATLPAFCPLNTLTFSLPRLLTMLLLLFGTLLGPQCLGHCFLRCLPGWLSLRTQAHRPLLRGLPGPSCLMSPGSLLVPPQPGIFSITRMAI